MIAWNDRRKARKAASNTMKTTLGMMAKTGAIKKLDAPSKDPIKRAREKSDNKAERGEVLESARRIKSEYDYRAEKSGSEKRLNKGTAINQAAQGNDMKRRQEARKQERGY